MPGIAAPAARLHAAVLGHDLWWGRWLWRHLRLPGRLALPWRRLSGLHDRLSQRQPRLRWHGPASDLGRGGTVYVCPGRYVGTYNPGSGSIIGAGDGDDPATSTILDANRNGRVMRIESGRTVSLHGLRLTGGFDDSVTASGGGVMNDGGLTMTDCTITGNETPIGTGGGLITYGPLTLTRCQVTENTAFYGGGIYAVSGTITLVRSVVSQNKSTNLGGGIAVYGGTLHVNDGSSVTDNTAADGGGIYRAGGTVTLNDAQVTDNEPNNGRPVASVANCTN